jgi:hypothetical protein
VDTGIPATDSGNGRVPHDSGDTSETGFADTAETGGEETGSQETGSVDTAETGDTGEDTGTEPTYSPCEESWVRLGYEAYLYTPVGGESNVEITLSTSTDFISLVWEDSSAPYSFYISCVETSGGLAGIIPAQYEDEYYASAWNEAEEGVTWHWDYATALSRDGVAFYSQGHSGDATRFTSTP